MSKSSNIRWKAIPRDALPDSIFGGSSASLSGKPAFERYDLVAGNVIAGFPDASTGSTYNPPCVFVLDGSATAETLSWLRVYAAETSPLSQFGRVISADDWRRFGSENEYRPEGIRHDKWASVIVGEALAQGDTDTELTSLPLSRASACFSTAIARAKSAHGTDESTRMCAERLRLVEADRRFARRLISVSDLLPIWALLGVRLIEDLEPQEATDFVLNAAQSYFQHTTAQGRPVLCNLSDYPQLGSDSIEQRVLAFHRLANDLVHATERSARNGMPAALLAAAAFLVGRGTSHEFLLRRTGKAFPGAPVWFGLIAAVAGAAAWDPEWMRATKGVERQVRVRFDWADTSGFDLSWTEFSWLAGTFEGPDIFSSLPKLATRAISIEVIPGAACHFKLASGGSVESEARAVTAPSAREKELQAALAQFIGLAGRARQLLDGQSEPAQQSLGLGSETTLPSKSSRPRKNKVSSK